MSPRKSERRRPHRVLLPSGREIDVVFSSPAGGGRPAAREGERLPETAHQDAGLHLCRRCGSPLVHPIDWEQAGPQRWLVSLRCPNCEWTGSGVFGQEAVDLFDEELERGCELLLGDLERMIRANVAEQVERFVTALEANALLPSDF